MSKLQTCQPCCRLRDGIGLNDTEITGALHKSTFSGALEIKACGNVWERIKGEKSETVSRKTSQGDLMQRKQKRNEKQKRKEKTTMFVCFKWVK